MHVEYRTGANSAIKPPQPYDFKGLCYTSPGSVQSQPSGLFRRRLTGKSSSVLSPPLHTHANPRLSSGTQLVHHPSKSCSSGYCVDAVFKSALGGKTDYKADDGRNVAYFTGDADKRNVSWKFTESGTIKCGCDARINEMCQWGTRFS